MPNPLRENRSRKWCADARSNALTLFDHHCVNVVVERRARLSLKALRAAIEAGASLESLLKAQRGWREIPQGFIRWNEEQEEFEVVCYFAECSLHLVNNILHAATCGCDGCWSRMQRPRTVLETEKF
jgi:hypothetical protein